MRKFNFYYIVALVGAMVLSISSCTKDLEDDVDALRKEVEANKSAIAALDNAIKSGKLITAVTAKSDGTGWEITFSDNQKILVNHGAKGDQGDQGIQGLPGIAGPAGPAGEAGFAPEIDIIDGFWVRKISKDGNFEPITDTEGNKIAASKKVEFVGGLLKVDGVAICTIPAIVLDKVNGVAHVSVWNEKSNKFDEFDVLLSDALNGVNSMIRSLVMPIQNLQVNVTTGIAATTFIDGPFAGEVTKGEILKTGGELPVIVNPTNGIILLDQISIENAKGESLPLTIESVSKGFNKEFQTRAAGTNGLWTVTLKSPSAEIINKTYSNYAIKVAKDNQEAVYSSYDYQIKVGKAKTLFTSVGPYTFGRIIGKEISFAGATESVQFGSDESLFEFSQEEDVYLSAISFKNATDKAKYEQYFEITSTSVKVKDTNAAHIALNNKSIDFIYTAVDYNGECLGYDKTTGKYNAAKDVVVRITFNSTIVKEEYDLPAVNHTLTDVPADRFKLTSLDPVYDALGGAETVLWRENASNFTVVIVDEQGVVMADSKMRGVIVDREGRTVTSGTQFPSHIKLIFNELQALPGEYVATFSYDDARPTAQKFTVKVPITVENPVVNTTIIKRVAAHFANDVASVYGERNFTLGTNQLIAQNVLNATFDLTTLYNNMTADKLTFVFEAINGSKPTVTNANIMTIKGTEMYKPYAVTVKYNHFGNSRNSVELDNIIVTPKSEITEGAVSLLTATTKFEVINGDTNSAVKLSTKIKVTDSYDYTVVFLNTNRDPRVANILVRVKADDPNAGLLQAPVLGTDGDWTISPKANQAGISANTQVAIEIVITDLYGQEKVHTTNVTVKKQ